MPGTPFRIAWFGVPLALWAGFVPNVRPVRAAERAERLAAVSSITTDEAKGLIDTLSDDSFEGREAGSRGGRAAGNLLMKEFEKHGLQPAGDGKTFFQSFNNASRNILGLLEGSDPELKNEVILIGAHYDHVGYGRATNSFGPFGYVHNGADDNASGVSGLIEVIEAMEMLPQPPRRSILFALWDAEEQGLLGSQHWLASPTLDKSRLVTAINLDMIGRLRNSRVEVFGSRTAPGLRRIVSQANRDGEFEIDFSWKMKADSDHWPFFARSIPSLMFHTGLHGDYHRPSDDAHTINAEGVAGVSRLVLLTLLDLANRETVEKFRPAARHEHPGMQTALEQPAAAQPPRFGIPFRWQTAEPHVVLAGTTLGSPAEKAGLRAGDRLVALAGRPIQDEMQFRLDLLAADGETSLTIERDGEATPLDIKLTPAGPPIRVGIKWRLDDAEPGTVLLTQVVYGSPAHLAGLAVRDRIYSVGGQAFAADAEFLRLITSLPAPIEIEYERQGRLKSAALDVLKPPAE